MHSFCNFINSRWWGTMSNVLEKSNMTVSVCWPWSKFLWISSIVVISWVSQEWPFLKTCCSLVKILCSSDDSLCDGRWYVPKFYSSLMLGRLDGNLQPQFCYLSCVLRIATTFAIFQSLGTSPFMIDCMKMVLFQLLYRSVVKPVLYRYWSSIHLYFREGIRKEVSETLF